jgi:DNA-binding MarR family transcriptional regulator
VPLHCLGLQPNPGVRPTMMVQSHELSSDDATKLERLLNAIDLFADQVDKDMPMQMIRAFLFAAIHEGDGPNELARKADVSSTVMSRHISDLGDINRYKLGGHELVYQKTDPMDRRSRKVHLTPKGVAFRNKLVRALGRK